MAVREFFLKFRRSPKSQIFVDHNALLKQYRDTYKEQKSENKLEIGHL